jgi:PAS domain S-box-containing protein
LKKKAALSDPDRHYKLGVTSFLAIETNKTDRIREAMLSWMNSHASQGIITTDETLRIRGWNRWLEVRSGRKAETVIGSDLLETFPELVARKLDYYYKRALEGQSGVLSQKLHRFLLEMPVSEKDTSEPMLQSVRISPLLEHGEIIGTVTVIEDVTERVRRESELQRQLEQRAHLLANESAARNAAEAASLRLQQLQMITDEAFAQMSVDDLLGTSVKAIKLILGSDTAAILLADPIGDLIVRATEGVASDVKGLRVPNGTGFAGMIARERRPLTVEGDLPPSPFTYLLAKEQIQALSGVPLLADKHLLGVLCVGMRRSHSIADDDLRFMSLVGDRIAAAIERVRLYNGEKEARAQAEEANRLKDQFLATVSHELRTPLNAILGWSRMLNSGRIDERTSKHALEVIERNARSQAQLIDDLLDVSRIISGKLRLNISPVEPLAIVDLALDAVRPAAEAKDIQLQRIYDPGTGTIPGDPDRLQQVIWNLLSNAIKFTPTGGKVSIGVQRTQTHIEFTVTDTGQGIEGEFLPYVFDRFRQADASVARAHGGLGLGLAIVRHLTELHGGTVEAQSEGEGRGATFIVRLPINVVSAAEFNANHLNKGTEVQFGNHSVLKGLRILIVDDEADSLDLMKTVLGECGAQPATARSAAEGFAAITSDPPDVLISDIEMPFEDGYTFIRKVRALSATEVSGIPAVALTAHANKEDRRRALNAGFQLHVRKPVEPSELVEAICRLVTGQIADPQDAQSVSGGD